MNNKFKVGDLVMISKSSKYYGSNSTNNPQDVKGVLTSIEGSDGNLPYYIEWSNGGGNGYEASDLILVEDVKEKTIHDILVERSTLEVGDTVIVTHKVPDNDLGWKCSWAGMDDAIGKECIVTESPKDSGVRLGGHGGNFLYPLQSIQLVRKRLNKINVLISKDYMAEVTEKNIQVGCQTITFSAFDELAEAVAKMRKQ
jgi:hypothetical protein